ncbi:FHA domain-containing protein [Jannaschia seohaensis]|uniref:FHA domain-containing protein n=1 Tax=Jannaschia seohaensis TaxID=475081 RepID=A0A2Y9B9N9_9RHOB|nr:FHA domain-containing protein [Jannaschia seohaensis]PWJ12498.1 FHA domain-containing protein [Jannaschia seohaensis]SSA50979.1 FHA domain-containing protein [Jannaschia seohaensis]
MKFLRNLFGKKSAQPSHPNPAAQQPVQRRAGASERALSAAEIAAARAAVPPTPKQGAEAPLATTQILQNLAERLKEPSATGIWDIEEDAPAPKAAAPAAPAMAKAPSNPTSPLAEMAARAPARSARRNKTRLIGFDTSEGSVVDLFDEDETATSLAGANAAPAASAVTFPVGWVLIVQGPGRGHAFPLSAGMSSIGRGEDQTVRLDFGDAAISRSGHAAIVYDPDERSFLLGQGGKSNIVRLNGKPVIASTEMNDGDEIKIGETILQLKALCGPDFDWSDTDGEEDDEDVAIA